MLRQVRRIAVAFVGGTVLTVGVAMIALPGPAVLVIPAGLAILATEFSWARHLLHRVRTAVDGLTRRRRPPPPNAETPEAVRSTELRAS